jgi:hypothetical protein
MRNSIVMWEHQAQQDVEVTCEPIEGFNARGMTRLYGRGDHFGNRTFNLDLWRSGDGRVLARFWSRSNEVDDESWAVTGGHADAQDEHQVPQCLRDRYDAWARSNI